MQIFYLIDLSKINGKIYLLLCIVQILKQSLFFMKSVLGQEKRSLLMAHLSYLFLQLYFIVVNEI